MIIIRPDNAGLKKIMLKLLTSERAAFHFFLLYLQIIVSIPHAFKSSTSSLFLAVFGLHHFPMNTHHPPLSLTLTRAHRLVATLPVSCGLSHLEWKRLYYQEHFLILFIFQQGFASVYRYI